MKNEKWIIEAASLLFIHFHELIMKCMDHVAISNQICNTIYTITTITKIQEVAFDKPRLVFVNEGNSSRWHW